ncbi:CDF family Co(II)/Ni(II) efflux transporter DmeF [Methylobacterium sp. Leaf117]|uniref:CDF family Co(II)/Ni(II) efflux transporter DmeF n=1 Tax=Methylobacterium sp. Leaf117 TaxID=1736260 RepID=UPI00070048D4|nr:CDF family Co(II)/Ni(II) efflux transporter DmeF [Methylobacterium sp. Leaf117]KQP79331.1 cation transporter [Methylobacterium sp. Leaf117]
MTYASPGRAPSVDDGAGVAHGHSHVFLGEGHDRNERRTWAVIALCGVMMAAEIFGGLVFGSIALVADGLHMSTHAGALLLAALAYRYARRHADDDRFTFGTGKLGDLAGFTSAIVLAMIALLIAYEAVLRLIEPVAIDYNETIAIAVLGLGVNLASVWLLGSDHDHGHHHDHGHDHHDHADATQTIVTSAGRFGMEIHEDGVPPRFRLTATGVESLASGEGMTIETVRPDGSRQTFATVRRGDVIESVETIPEPHAFEAILRLSGSDSIWSVTFEEHAHGHHGAMHRDNNMRAAVVHVVADAAVSVLVIAGLLLARFLGWTWMDPLAAIVGSIVIASWAYTLVRDTGGVLLDMQPDPSLAGRVRDIIQAQGDRIADLHLWRLGPGHLGAIVSVVTAKGRGPDYYRHLLGGVGTLSHLTVEVRDEVRP